MASMDDDESYDEDSDDEVDEDDEFEPTSRRKRKKSTGRHKTQKAVKKKKTATTPSQSLDQQFWRGPAGPLLLDFVLQHWNGPNHRVCADAVASQLNQSLQTSLSAEQVSSRLKNQSIPLNSPNDPEDFIEKVRSEGRPPDPTIKIPTSAFINDLSRELTKFGNKASSLAKSKTHLKSAVAQGATWPSLAVGSSRPLGPHRPLTSVSSSVVPPQPSSTMQHDDFTISSVGSGRHGVVHWAFDLDYKLYIIVAPPVNTTVTLLLQREPHHRIKLELVSGAVDDVIGQKDLFVKVLWLDHLFKERTLRMCLQEEARSTIFIKTPELEFKEGPEEVTSSAIELKVGSAKTLQSFYAWRIALRPPH